MSPVDRLKKRKIIKWIDWSCEENIALVFVWFYRVKHRFRKWTVKFWYGLYKTARSQHIYLSCNEKRKTKNNECWKSPIYRENKKKSVSGTKPSVSVPSWSEYVSRNKRKSVSEKWPSISVDILSDYVNENKRKMYFRNVTLYFRERLGRPM